MRKYRLLSGVAHRCSVYDTVLIYEFSRIRSFHPQRENQGVSQFGKQIRVIRQTNGLSVSFMSLPTTGAFSPIKLVGHDTENLLLP